MTKTKGYPNLSSPIKAEHVSVLCVWADGYIFFGHKDSSSVSRTSWFLSINKK